MKSAYPIALHLLCLIPLITVLIALWAVFGNEDAIYAFFTAYRADHENLTRGVKFFSSWGNVLFYPVYGLMLLTGTRCKKPELTRFVLAWLLAQIIVPLLLGRIFKFAVGRPRPMTGGSCVPFALDSAHHSFPSGHTMETTGSCLPLIQRYRSVLLTLFLGLFLAAMGFSRVYLSMHHPTDVAAALVLGSFGGWLSWRFAHLPLYWWRQLKRHKDKPKMPWRGI